MMTKLRIAVIPVDQKVAIKMRWGAMPLESLVAALSKQTERRQRANPPHRHSSQAHDQWRHGDGFVLRDGRLGRTPRIRTRRRVVPPDAEALMLWQARVLAPDLPSMPQPEGAGRPRHRERSVEIDAGVVCNGNDVPLFFA